MKIPAAYRPSYRKALSVDAEAAENYVSHTLIGDPVMEAVVEDLEPLPQKQVHEFIQAGMEQDPEGLKNAPESLRDFFSGGIADPDWLDHDAFGPGIRVFQRNSGQILTGFVGGVLTDGFRTLISKSFVERGRIFDSGVRRLRQNNRHQLEIFLPGGLQRFGDGWKLSVRIRFIHAHVRRMLIRDTDWDADTWGVPISAAHLGYAAACFATRTVHHSESLGVRYTEEERAGFHAVWRYAGYLMGIPETILFEDEQHARQIYRTASDCEPPPLEDSIIMSHALVNSTPLVAGVEDAAERKRLVDKEIYPLCRALIGNKLADQLQFPPRRMLFTLFWYRLSVRIQRLKAKLFNKQSYDLSTLLMISTYDDAGLSYRLPDHVHDEESKDW